MSLDMVLAFVQTCSDASVLGRIRAATNNRERELAEAGRKVIEDEAWTRYRRFKPGITVWCCSSGTFLGGPMQRGDKAIVEHVQPRARRLWLKIKGKRWWFQGFEAARYEFKTVAPPKDSEEQERMRRIASRLSEAL